MSDVPATTGPTAMLSPDQHAALQAARAATARASVPRPPEIKLLNTMMKVPGVQKGEFFIKKWNPETKENEITPIGKSPRVVILHRAYSYSYYDEDAEALVAWTSEFTGFDALDPVTLFRQVDGKAAVEKESGYQEMKRYLQEKYSITKPSGAKKSLMTFRNVLYVLYEGSVYRMFVSNASAAGVASPDDNPDFKNPQPLSLLDFIERAGANRESAYFESVCELGSAHVEGEREFYLMIFTLVGTNPDLGPTIDTWKRLLHDLSLPDIVQHKHVLNQAISGLDSLHTHFDGLVKHFQTLRDEAADKRRKLTRDFDDCKDAYWIVKNEKGRVESDGHSHPAS